VNVFCASLIEEIHFLSYKFPWANTWVLWIPLNIPNQGKASFFKKK
jgi:hypothetical protein